MIPAAPHPQETERLAALRRLLVLDTAPEQIFDDLVQVAAQLTGCPISLVSLVDAHRQWFKAKVGIDAEETPRDIAFCAHAILTPDAVFEVPDATKDVRFHDNPLVALDPSIRFYAGIPLVEPGGMPIGTLCVIDRVPHNLTEAQRDALHRLGRQVVAGLELRRLMRESLALNAELAASRDAALKANQEKSGFLAHMSHEIRTPLNGIIGITSLLQESELGVQQQEQIELIRTSGDALLDLINDILDLSKIESGHFQLEAEPFDLIALIDESAAMVATAIEKKGLDFQVCVAPEVPAKLVGDAQRLRQILINLLSNAKKFTENGSIRVLVGTGAGPGDLRIQVTDTGVGMTPEVAARIFQPYMQADASTARCYGGTGLGLTISRQLVEMMGGTLTVASASGVGTTFTCTLTLPVADLTRFWPDLDGATVDIPASLLLVLGPWLPVWNAVPAVPGLAPEVALVDVRTPSTPRPGVPTIAVTGLGDGALAGSGFASRLTRPLRLERTAFALARSLGQRPGSASYPTVETHPVALRGTVLVIDDNQVNLKVASAMLQNLGLQVAAADNGRDGLVICAQGGIDLVLMDCQMPELDGFATTGLLRQEEARRGGGRNVPVIALTANAMAGDRQQCLDVGMNDYLTKPIRRDTLVTMLRRWLPEQKSQMTSGVDFSIPDSPPVSVPDLDRQVIRHLLADLGDPTGAILPELLANFRSQTTSLNANLCAAAAVGDHLQVARTAHNLKGQAMTLGFARFASLAKDLEAAAKAGDSPTCQRLSQDLADVQVRAEQALMHWT